MKKVFLYAYDRMNLGDDLFVHTVTKRYPNVKFYMLSKKENQKTFRELKNLVVIDKESSFIKLLRRIRPSFVPKYINWIEKRCTAVVYIGGSIFIEYDNWEQMLTWWDYESKNRPFYVLGANFGPYTTEAYRNKLAEIFNNMQDVCFREKYSLDKFSDVSVARWAPDILFSYDMPKVQQMKKQIFVSLIDCGSRQTGLERLEQYESDYLTFMKELHEKYMQEGYTLVLSSFCKSEKDEEAIEKVLSVMDISEEHSQVEVLRYDGNNFEKVLCAIAESELVVASRFHAAILGFVADKPVFPVFYSDKTLHVLEESGFNGKYADIRQLAQVDFGFQEEIEKQKLYNIDEIKMQSEKHFMKLDEVLGEKRY